ncbi:MAPK/MAK/MRK overlapping kinase-like [Adelges cooleyi]|uniref:MAPK/MAK/MRK overlapping kinase-like n=1 Tax=Adelges cooleyi TaxID=133065 RepID=UPI00217F2E8D|nr:MAPK/MAK/MRK overlapping kinase-like [Adelges cooleyi]
MITQTRGGNGCFSADYELIEKIGEGTFSDVWRCVQRDGGREMAAKVLKKTYKGPMDAAAWATIHEVNVTKSIDRHPYLLLVECAYHESDTGSLVLITELMKRSLYDVIESEGCPISDYRIKLYMYQLLEGIKYLHENNIIHRDVKPENILLSTGDRMLKIGDLGTACVAEKGKRYTEYVATRWYRSPECLLTRGCYGIKMDIWAAGCVLFEMATSRPLFDGADEDDQMFKIDRVLGKPDSRLLEKFKRYKSEVFTKRYMSGEPANVGVGLQSLYQPYRPGFDLIKEMIVYDPSKRSTAERLLRKSYFFEMKHSMYEQRVRDFEERLKNQTLIDLSQIWHQLTFLTHSTLRRIKRKLCRALFYYIHLIMFF